MSIAGWSPRAAANAIETWTDGGPDARMAALDRARAKAGMSRSRPSGGAGGAGLRACS